MKDSSKVILFSAVVVILMALIVFGTGNNNQPPASSMNSSQQEKLNETNASSLITESQLAEHGSKEDCWISYKGTVYDITDWLPKHPGSSEAIEPFCGTSSGFEEAFTQKHGTSKANLLMQVGRLIGYFEKVGEI